MIQSQQPAGRVPFAIYRSFFIGYRSVLTLHSAVQYYLGRGHHGIVVGFWCGSFDRVRTHEEQLGYTARHDPQTKSQLTRSIFSRLRPVFVCVFSAALVCVFCFCSVGGLRRRHSFYAFSSVLVELFVFWFAIMPVCKQDGKPFEKILFDSMD